MQQLRVASGWTLGKLAARLGISKGSLEKLESGENPVLPHHLHELSRMAQVSVDWFFLPALPMDMCSLSGYPTLTASMADEVRLLVQYVAALPSAKRRALRDFLRESRDDEAGEE